MSWQQLRIYLKKTGKNPDAHPVYGIQLRYDLLCLSKNVTAAFLHSYTRQYDIGE